MRIYRTNARQFFHADDADLVGLLCVAKALEGGESDLVSLLLCLKERLFTNAVFYRSVATRFGMTSRRTIPMSQNSLHSLFGTLTVRVRRAKVRKSGSKPQSSTSKQGITPECTASKSRRVDSDQGRTEELT